MRKAVFYVIGLVFSAVLSAQSQLIPFQDVNNSWGYKDSKTGKVVIPARYASVREFYDGLAGISDKGKTGFINAKGEIVVPVQYDYAGDFSKGFAIAARQKIIADTASVLIYGIIDTKGTEVLPFEYNLISYIGDNLIRLASTDEEGYNLECFTLRDFTPVLFPVRCQVQEMDSAGFIPIQKGNELFYIHLSGLIVENKTEFRGNYIVKSSGNYGIISPSGEILIPIDNTAIYYTGTSEKPTSKAETFIKVEKGAKFGLINRHSKLTVPIQYSSLTKISESLYLVSENEYKGVIDTAGVALIPVQYQRLDPPENGCFLVKQNEKFGLISMKGEIIAPLTYGFFERYGYGLFLIKQENKWSFVDSTGIELKVQYEDLKKLNPQASLFKRDSKWGVLLLADRKEKISPIFDSVYSFDDLHIAKVQINAQRNRATGKFEGGKVGYINWMGDIIVPAEYDRVSPFNNGIATCYINNEFYSYDLNGNRIVNSYDNICYAIEAGDLDAVRNFIKEGVDLNKLYKNKSSTTERTPLQCLLSSNMPRLTEILTLLLENGAIQNGYNCNSIPDKNLKIEIFKILIATSFDLNINAENYTPLLYRVIDTSTDKKEMLEFVKLLVEGKINVNAPEPVTGNTVLHLLAMKGSDPEIIETVRFLVNNGASTKIKSKTKETVGKIARKQKQSKEFSKALRGK